MNKQQQEQFFKAYTERMANVLLSKGDDYANEDRLSNFKLAGAVAGNSPEVNCLNLIATKVARLGILLNYNVQAKNESIEDSIMDLANYAVLLAMIREDRGVIRDTRPADIAPR